MKFEDAIKKSIKSFLAGKTPEALRATKEEDFIYSSEYFDMLEEELLEEPTDTTKARLDEEEEINAA
jgi:hypothetical protein|tara:strand:+ start:1319 stop:1519 length:201 start_codon:yes stop_codon:yes gene_type:complete